MHDFESLDLAQSANDTFRKELRLGQEVSYHIARQSELEAADTIPLFGNTKQTFAVTNMLLNYTVLDVAGWIQNIHNIGSSSLAVPERQGKLPMKQLSRVVCTISWF
jgi:hypothetical protein